MSHRPTRMECVLDWLGRSALVLVLLVGAIQLYNQLCPVAAPVGCAVGRETLEKK
jgi:hypothetical protein